jgi:hypothetical protein
MVPKFAFKLNLYRYSTGSLQRTREAVYVDRYGDNLGGLGDDPSGYFNGAAGFTAGAAARGVLSEQVNNGQQQQQQRRAVVGPGGRVRARPQSAAAAMTTGGRGGAGGGGAGGDGAYVEPAAGIGGGLPRGATLRGMFGDVEAPSQTYGAAWGVPDPSEMGLL